MNRPLIRIKKIEVQNFKNIENGSIEFKSNNFSPNIYGSEIMGIYGQNGSGKTAVIEALLFLKIILTGKSLPDYSSDYIYLAATKTLLKLELYISNDNISYNVFYNFVFRRTNESFEIASETLSYRKIGEQEKIDIIRFDVDDSSSPFFPKSRYEELSKLNKDLEFEFEVTRRMSRKECKSYIFNKDTIRAFNSSEIALDYYNIITWIQFYAKFNLFVITNQHSAPIALNFMPICFRVENEKSISSGDIHVWLHEPSLIDIEKYSIVQSITDQMNIVLSKIIPGLYVYIENLGKELSRENKEMIKIELFTCRNNMKVPLKYESEGIKRIVSILSALISMFNNPSICLAVDELDSGIFEYLLGELLDIIEKHGQGQLIFTSHNLRALEKLNKNSIIVSTANSKNRFIRMKNIKKNNNLRNMYLRGVDLGGLDESIYEETNTYEIAYAFRKAGDCFGKN